MNNSDPAQPDVFRNTLTSAQDKLDRAQIGVVFADLGPNPGPDALLLRPYLNSRPQKYFNRSAFDTYLSWLKQLSVSDSNRFAKHLEDQATDIGRAFQFLGEINDGEWHEDSLSHGDEYELILTIDRSIHPSYLRLVEAVLYPLIRPIAFINRIRRSKSTEGLALWDVIEEVRRTPQGNLIADYQHAIRNGIAHGKIVFLQRKIRYLTRDGGNLEIGFQELIRFFDNLLDTCNGIAAAINVFLLTQTGSKLEVPRELLGDALREITRTPWWEIAGCVEAELTSGQRQLTIYARTNTRDIRKVEWSAFQSAVVAERTAPGFDRYFLSIHANFAWPGWAGFDGRRLRALRESQAQEISDYKGVLEDVIFYVPRFKLPKILGSIDTLIKSFLCNVPPVMLELKSRIGIPKIDCRESKAHRQGWRVVLNSVVVLDEVNSQEFQGVIRANKRRIVRLAKKKARKGTFFSWARWLPVGFARVLVFRKDYRRRRFSSFGLGPDLVGTVVSQSISRIQSPDIFGGTAESEGKWRIVWNEQWLSDSETNY